MTANRPRWNRPPVADTGGVRLVPIADLRKLHRMLLLLISIQVVAVALQLWNVTHG